MKPLILTLLYLFSLTSCYSQKSYSNANHSETMGVNELPPKKIGMPETSDDLRVPELAWEHFSGKYNIDIDLGNGQEYNGILSFRMKKDSVIWFSITASIGFQIAKGIITKDSFHALDLLGKNYYRSTLESFQKSTGLPAKIDVIQKIFTGEVWSKYATYDAHDSSWRDVNLFKGYSGKTNGTGLLIRNALFDESTKSQLLIDYKSHLTATDKQIAVASESQMTIQDALNTIRLQLQLKTSSFDVIPSYPFNVPSGYKVMDSW